MCARRRLFTVSGTRPYFPQALIFSAAVTEADATQRALHEASATQKLCYGASNSKLHISESDLLLGVPFQSLSRH